MYKKIAWALFGVGTAIAISGGAKLPAEGSDWPDTVRMFLVGALLAAVGVFLWRKAMQAEKKANLSAAVSGDSAKPSAFKLLADAMEPSKQLQSAAADLDEAALTKKVDELLETYILPFAEVRQTVIDRFGMTTGAEILVTVAYGERMLNRVWSAASDGHLPEARACVPEAVDALVQAQDLIERASSAA